MAHSGEPLLRLAALVQHIHGARNRHDARRPRLRREGRMRSSVHNDDVQGKVENTMKTWRGRWGTIYTPRQHTHHPLTFFVFRYRGAMAPTSAMEATSASGWPMSGRPLCGAGMVQAFLRSCFVHFTATANTTSPELLPQLLTGCLTLIW